jgi:hypothetical protein
MKKHLVQFLVAALTSILTVVHAVYLIRYPLTNQPWLWPDMGSEYAPTETNPALIAQGIANQGMYIFWFVMLFATASVAGWVWLQFSKRVGLQSIAGWTAFFGHISIAGYLAWASMWTIDNVIEDAGIAVSHSSEDTLHNVMSLGSFLTWPVLGVFALACLVFGLIRGSRNADSEQVSA